MQMPPGAGAPAQPQNPAQAQDSSGDDQIINQIGALLQKLPPEKQKAVIMQLEQMLGINDDAQPSAPQGVGSPDAGANGVPSEQV